MEPALHRPAKRRAEDHGPLFSRPAAADRKLERARLQERLRPVVVELAKRRGAEGITASEVTTEGILAGVLNQDAIERAPRIYAWIGPWMAGLARHGALKPKVAQLQGGGEIHVRRASERDDSHRNLGLVYLHAEVDG